MVMADMETGEVGVGEVVVVMVGGEGGELVDLGGEEEAEVVLGVVGKRHLEWHVSMGVIGNTMAFTPYKLVGHELHTNFLPRYS